MIDQLPLLDAEPSPPAAPAPRAPTAPVNRLAALPASGATPRPILAWLIDDVLLPCYRAIIPLLNVWRWADAGNVFLDEKASPTPGFYNSQKTPWIRRFVQTFTDAEFGTRRREHHVMKSSRSGFTEAGLCVIRWMPKNRPGPALYAIDTIEEAKKVSERRLVPTLPASARTADADDITKKHIKLLNMDIEIGGSYSKSLFLNKFLLLILLDEVDAVDIPEDGETIQGQARTRMTGVPGSTLYAISKPRKWRSPHHVEVATGTLEAFLVPCPHCGTFQELSFDGNSPTHALRIDEPLKHGQPNVSPPLGRYDPAVQAYTTIPPPRCGRVVFEHCKDLLGNWDLAKVRHETYYECVAGCRIDQRETLGAEILGTPRAEFFSAEVHTLLAARRLTVKHAMVLSGHELQTNPRPQLDKRSTHNSDLYALHDDMTWGDLAEKFINAKGDPSALGTFINNHLGLPKREKKVDVGIEQLHHCRAPYQRGTLPFAPDFLTIGFDTQDDSWRYVTTGYRFNGENAIANWGIVGSKEELLEEFNRPIPLASDPSQTFTPLTGFCDAGGHRTDDVYDLHLASWSESRQAYRVFPIFGRDFRTNTKIVWYSESVIHKFRKIRVFFCADDVFKRRLYHGSIAKAGATRKAIADARAAGLNEMDAPWLKQKEPLPPPMHYPAAPGDELLSKLQAELLSEQLDPDTGKWAKHGPNDFGDCKKYCDVMFEYMLPLLLEEKQRASKAAKAAPAT